MCCARGEGRGGEGFDVLAEGRMVVLEALVVREIPRPRSVEHGADEAGGASADAAGRPDVFGGCFRLARDDHRAEAGHVHADGDHVRREQHVERDMLALL